MKTKSKIIAGMLALVLIGGASLTAFAATRYGSPMEALAGLTGKSEDALYEEMRQEDKRLYELAEEAGVLEAFREEMLELRKERIQSFVEEGRITQEEADRMLERMEERDFEGRMGFGRGFGRSFGGCREEESQGFQGFRGFMGFGRGMRGNR